MTAARWTKHRIGLANIRCEHDAVIRSRLFLPALRLPMFS